MPARTLSAHAAHGLRIDRGRIRRFARFLSGMAQAIATRRQLAEMDDRMLSDIGISRADALAEFSRAPWDCGPRPARPGHPSHIARLQAWWREGLRRQRTRQHIAELDERMLKDIGITFAEAEHEANKPFWRT